MAAIKIFALVFSNKKANPVSKKVHKIRVRMKPKIGDPVKVVIVKKEKAPKEMIPSRKSANRPAYSLKSAPVEAKSSGVEKDKTFSRVEKN